MITQKFFRAAAFLTIVEMWATQATAQVSVRNYERAAVDKVRRGQAAARKAEADAQAAAARASMASAKALAEQRQQEKIRQKGELCSAVRRRSDAESYFNVCLDAAENGDIDSVVYVADRLMKSDATFRSGFDLIFRYAKIDLITKHVKDRKLIPGYLLGEADRVFADGIVKNPNYAMEVLNSKQRFVSKKMSLSELLEMAYFAYGEGSESAAHMVISELIGIEPPIVGAKFSRTEIDPYSFEYSQFFNRPQTFKMFLYFGMENGRSGFFKMKACSTDLPRRLPLSKQAKTVQDYLCEFVDDEWRRSIEPAIGQNGEPHDSVHTVKIRFQCKSDLRSNVTSCEFYPQSFESRINSEIDFTTGK